MPMLMRSHQRRFDQPIAFEIGADALLIAWDEEASSSRTTVALGGTPIARRRASLKLARAPGITRHVLAFQAADAIKSPITLTHDGATVAEVPVADDATHASSLLLGGMSDAGKARI